MIYDINLADKHLQTFSFHFAIFIIIVIGIIIIIKVVAVRLTKMLNLKLQGLIRHKCIDLLRQNTEKALFRK